MAAGVLAGIALIAGTAWYWHARRSAPAAPLPDQQTFAVLPAGVESGSDWAWMRLGVMDIVAARLRSSGVPSVPSESVVALLHAPVAQRGDDLHETLAVRFLVTPHVHQEQELWRVDLDAQDRSGQHYLAGAQARDASTATRAATDRLLAALGLTDASDARALLICQPCRDS